MILLLYYTLSTCTLHNIRVENVLNFSSLNQTVKDSSSSSSSTANLSVKAYNKAHILSYIKLCVQSQMNYKTSKLFDDGLDKWYAYMNDQRKVICNFFNNYTALNSCININPSSGDSISNFLLITTLQLCNIFDSEPEPTAGLKGIN